MTPQPRSRLAPWVAVGTVGLAVEAVLLMVWQGNADWGFSNGVYAESSRQFLHGVLPYRQFAAAQPPGIFLLGTALLAIGDSVTALHVGLAAVELVTAALVSACVWRIERSRAAALSAGILAPLLPISLANHTQLIPETVAAPLILRGALCCARGSKLGGVLLALAVWTKVAFVIPAVAVVAATRHRRVSVASFALATLALWAVAWAYFGPALWRQVFIAQADVGLASLHYVAGLLAQAAWNLLPVLVGAIAFAFTSQRTRSDSGDDNLARTLLGAAAGGLLVLLTVFKRGSYLNVAVVAEPPLLALATPMIWRAFRRSRRAAAPAAAVLAFLLAQSASILVHPADPWVAVRPFAASGLRWSASPSAVDREVAAARRCPPGVAYSGSPYIAFLADRRMPGLQPDLFIIRHSRADAPFAARAARDRPVCP